MPGEALRSQRPIPFSIAPLPSGTTTASSGSGKAVSSRPIVPAPSLISGSTLSSTKRQPRVIARARPSILASSKSSPTSTTSAPSARIRATLSGFAVRAAKIVREAPWRRAA